MVSESGTFRHYFFPEKSLTQSLEEDDVYAPTTIERPILITSPLMFSEVAQKELRETTFQSKILQLLGLPEWTATRVPMLADGCLHLTNYLLAQEAGDEIDTLLFLDKSARPAAYLFRIFWTELEKRGYIPEETKLPEIRFINVGKETYTPLSEATTHVRAHYHAAAFDACRVLVVDERTHSARSVAWTMKLIEKSFNVDQVEGISMFADFPPWYIYERMRLVEDKPGSGRYDLQYSIENLITNPVSHSERFPAVMYRMLLKRIAKKAAGLVERSDGAH